ncbi:MAG: hypothetical protein Q9P01_04625 [Anaerolineae bacterium]|nr:hypothetical protein [Anaerolineae bacterium]
MNQGKALYKLQEIDLGLIRRDKRLQAIEAQLADNDAVKAAQVTVDIAEEELKPLQKNLRDLELQVQSTRSKRNNTETRLYSGSVTNPKELQDMQNEIESLKKWHAELEDRMLEVMLGVEEAESVLNDAQDTLAQVMEAAATENQDLLSEKQALISEVSHLQEKRIAAIAAVDETNLKLYDTMRPQKANQPIAKLNSDDTCSACGIRQMGVVTQEIRRSEELIYCRNCKRLLVAL